MKSFKEWLNEQNLNETYTKYDIITAEFTRNGKTLNFKDAKDLFSEDYVDEFKSLEDFNRFLNERNSLKYFKTKDSFSTMIENIFYDDFKVSLDKDKNFIVDFKDKYKTRLIFKSKTDPSLTNGL